MRQGILFFTLFLSFSSVYSEEAVNKPSQPPSEAPSVELLADPQQTLAMIGKTPILVKDILESYHQHLKQMKEQKMTLSPPVHDYIVTSLISRRIEEILMLAEAEKKGLAYDPVKLDEILNKLKTKFKTPEDYQKYIQEKGLTEEEVIKKLQERFLINAFQEDLFKNLAVSDEEVKNFFIQNEKRINPPESWKIAQIMKRFPENSAEFEIERIKEELNLLRKEILEKGIPFEKMAQMHSQGASAGQGGKIGWITAETSLEPELFEGIKSLKKGELSPVIVLKSSVQLIKIDDYIPLSEKKTFDTVKSQIKDSLILEKKKMALTEFVQNSKKNVAVEIFYKSSLS